MRDERADAAVEVLEAVTGYEHDLAPFDRALTDLLDVITTMPDRDRQWAVYVVDFTAAARVRFQLLGEQEDIDKAVAMARQAIDEGPAEVRLALRCDLMDTVWLRAQYSGDRGDLDEAMAHAEALLPELPVDDDGLGIVVRLSYANMLDLRYSVDHDLADLDAAIALWRLLLSAASLDDEDRPVVLTSAGAALHRRYEHHRRPADLDEAVSVLEQAIAHDHALRARNAYELAGVFLQRFQARRDPADADASIAVARHELTRCDDEERHALLSVLSRALAARFGIHHEPPDLAEAVDAGLAAVDGLPEGHPDEGMYRNAVATLLRTRWAAGGAPSDLDDAIEWGRQAVAAAGDDHPGAPEFWHNLSGSLRVRGTPADLDESVVASRRAGAAVGHPYRALYLWELCMSLFLRFAHSDDVDDLTAAVAAGTTALDLPAAHHPQQEALLVDVLYRRYEVDGDADDLDQAIALARSAPATPPLLFKLANMLWARFEVASRAEDRDQAIEYERAAAEEDPETVLYGGVLLAMLQARYEATGRHGDLDESVDLGRRLVAVAPDEEQPLAGLSGALWTRFRALGARADLDEAIATGELLLENTQTPGDGATSYGGILARQYRDRYEHFHDPADRVAAERWERLAGVERDPFDDVVGPGDGDGWASKRGLQGAALTELAMEEGDPTALDRGIIMIGEAVGLFSAGHPGRVEAMANLTAALWLRYTWTGELADLDRAIDTGRAALAAGGGDDVRRSLSAALLARFTRFNRLSDVDEVIEQSRAVIDRAADGHEKVVLLSNLSISLRARYGLTGQRDDVQEAVAAGRAAVDADTEDHPIPLSNLSATLLLRFRALGDRADLAEAVSYGRAAVAAFPPDHPDRAAGFENLSAALRERSEWSADQSDLDEAVEMGRAAVAASPPGYAELPMYLSDLGNALRQRYFQRGVLADLDEGITATRAAVDAVAADHPERRRYLSNLAVLLRHRFADLRERADLTAAVGFARAAVAASSEDHPDHPHHLINLAATLLQSAEDDDDIDEAVALSRTALARVPADSGNRPGFLNNLAMVLHGRYIARQDAADLDEAISTARAAVDTPHTDHTDHVLHLSMLTGLLLSRGSSQDVDEAIGLARESVASARGATARADFTAVLARGLRRRFDLTGDVAALDEALSVWREVFEDPTALPPTRLDAGAAAGALAAANGRWADAVDGYAIAVEMLPLVAWRGSGRESREQALTRWAGLASAAAECALSAGQPDRAVELLEHGRGVLWSQTLDTRTDITALRDAAPAHAARLSALRAELDAESAVDRKMSLSVRWEALVTEIRALDGFSSFLRPPSVRELRTDGLVVIVTAGRTRCDAILFGPADTTVVELPVTAADVAGQATAYLNALLAAESGDLVAELDLTQTLEWLWDNVTGPVFEAMGEPPERLWWCPAGPFCLLPLHAAGHHDERAGRTVLDRAITSYTPTLRSLVASRSAGHYPADNRMLVVALPETPGQQPLPNTARERDHLVEVFAAPRHTLTQGPAATRETVRTQLRAHAWAHFSCHGDQLLDDPSRGGLLLHDGILTIAELADERYRGEFAFLSACKTATGGLQIPDEAITVAAALQYTGWRHVIGTLWTVWDDSAADIATAVYDHMTASGDFHPHTAATALHRAVRHQRDARPGRPSGWAPFIHIGP